jgi:hypothetical protein
MQVTETEVNYPLYIRNEHGQDISNPYALLVVMCAMFVLLLSLGICCLVFLPYISVILSFLIDLFAILCILYSLIGAMTIPILVRGLRTGPWQLRINREGIFYSYILSIFIRWDEITALVPSTFWGMSKLSIVVRDEVTVFKRFLELNARNRWEMTYYRLVVQLNIWISRNFFHVPSPFYLGQKLLPISIGTLVMVIQEQFESKLREHRISFRHY